MDVTRTWKTGKLTGFWIMNSGFSRNCFCYSGEQNISFQARVTLPSLISIRCISSRYAFARGH